MDMLVAQVLAALRGMWQWRWIGLGVAWLVGIVAAVIVARMPNQYEASARIYVDTQSVLKPLMAGLAVQPNIDQQIGILSRTLISRPNIEKLSRMADLDHSIRSKQDQDQLIDRLMKTVAIRGTGRDNLYILSYRDTEPQKAVRVVQSLTSIFVESGLGSKRKDTDSARQFIEDQIKIYEKKLAEAESRLKDFKLRNMYVTGEGRDAFSRINELTSSLNQARLELQEAEMGRDALKRQIAGEEPVLRGDKQAGGPPAIVVPELDGRIDALRRNLDLLLQRFTDQHPDVVGTRRMIRELEEQRQQEVAVRKKAMEAEGAVPTQSTRNPVYQQLKISLAQAEANVAALRTRVAEYEQRYSRFKASMNVMPEIEAEYAQLNRDYDVHKNHYQSLVTRRETAVLSGQMEASGTAEFRLIDPPRVTPQPVAPNRILLLTMAFAVALGAGLFASFLASQIRPSFFDARALREVTGVPVLGTVSLIVSEPMRRKERRNLVGFIGGTVALIGSYSAGIFALLMVAARTG